VIGGLLLFVAAAYIVELIFSQPNLAQLGKGMAIPSLPTSKRCSWPPGCWGDHHAARDLPALLADPASARWDAQRALSATKWDVAIAMTIAGLSIWR
jgi:manganese transport protein